MKTDSTLTVDPLSEGIDEDVELRRDGLPADDVSLTLPLPLTARAAVRYIHLAGPEELFDIELDVSYESWSRVERFTLETNGLQANLLGQRLPIDRIEVTKQWRDTLSVQLGGDYNMLPDLLTLRGGVFYETAVSENRYANVDFVGGQQFGGALGTSVFIDNVELALAYEYRHQPRVWVNEGNAGVYQEAPASLCEAPYTDPDNCDPRYAGLPSPPVNAGSYRAHSHGASVDVLYRF
jgi:long-subunit fatty acid transport protein